jgi:hypothetical protein
VRETAPGVESPPFTSQIIFARHLCRALRLGPLSSARVASIIFCAMSSPSYSKLLRHPNWQRRRLEIMERDKFRCLVCGDTGTTLNVHHLFYESGLKPWEYPEWSLMTLCEPHHAEEERFKTQADWHIASAFRRLGANNQMMDKIALMLEEITTHGRTPGSALYEIDLAIGEIWTKQTWRDEK